MAEDFPGDVAGATDAALLPPPPPLPPVLLTNEVAVPVVLAFDINDTGLVSDGVDADNNGATTATGGTADADIVCCNDCSGDWRDGTCGSAPSVLARAA